MPQMEETKEIQKINTMWDPRPEKNTLVEKLVKV